MADPLPGNVSTLVIGGSGRTGRLVVQRLLERGVGVRVLSRGRAVPQGAELVRGSITAPEEVKRALMGIRGVVIVVESADTDDAPNSPEQVHYQGVRHVIRLAFAGTYVVLVTQIYITRPERYPEMRHVIRWRAAGEKALRESGLAYTIVRPSWLVDDAQAQGVRLEQGDHGEGQVSRAGVAETCVQALSYAEAQGKTFELYRAENFVTDWQQVFALLRLDTDKAL